MRAQRKREAGFTLIEIMIVVLIIGILLAIAVPNFVKARETSRAKTCISNLKQIDAAKEQWAMDFKKTTGASPDALALTTEGVEQGKYIKTFPECPSGAVYAIDVIGTNPSCDFAGGTHVLP